MFYINYHNSSRIHWGQLTWLRNISIWWRNRWITPLAVTVPVRFRLVTWLGFKQHSTSSTPSAWKPLQETSSVWILDSENPNSSLLSMYIYIPTWLTLISCILVHVVNFLDTKVYNHRFLTYVSYVFNKCLCI